MKYPTPTLNALPDGAVLDQRFKLAVELAKTPGYYRLWLEANKEHEIPTLIDAFGAFCCGAADAVYTAGERRGWIDPLPTTADISPTEIAHIQRAAAANVHGQVHAQRVHADEQSRVQRVSGLVS